MLAHKVLDNVSQELIALNRKRSDELLLEIFETLSEGMIKFAGRTSNKKAQQLSGEFIVLRSDLADLIRKEKETV